MVIILIPLPRASILHGRCFLWFRGSEAYNWSCKDCFFGIPSFWWGTPHTCPLKRCYKKTEKGTFFFLQYTTPYQTITNLSLKEKKNWRQTVKLSISRIIQVQHIAHNPPLKSSVCLPYKVDPLMGLNSHIGFINETESVCAVTN